MRETNNLSISDSFFLIDSDNLSGVKSKLYGFALVDGHTVYNIENEDIPVSGEGAYIYVEKKDSAISVKQDFIGGQGIYLYQDKEYFALSNSFMLLLDHVKGHHPISFNRIFADNYLGAPVCPITYNETMINEISCIDRNIEIIIDISSKEISYKEKDFGEDTIALDSELGFETLDKWYEKWVSIIYNLTLSDNNISVDLSGGFDTRQIFTLFLDSRIDLNKIRVRSETDGLHTHSEDYEIASSIAEHFGFELNKHRGDESFDFNTMEDLIAISLYTKLGFHKQMYWKLGSSNSKRYHFGGYGGGIMRGGELSEPEDSFIQIKAEAGGKFDAAFEEPIRVAVKNAFDKTRAKYLKFGRTISEQDITRQVYKDTRNRNHFGKGFFEAFLGSMVQYAPLLDPDYQKLKLYTADCKDNNLFPAVVMSRYCPDLLDFKFDSGRFISPETIKYAKELNEKYPYVRKDGTDINADYAGKGNDSESPKSDDSCRIFECKEKTYSVNPQITKAHANDVMKGYFYSREVCETITQLYGDMVYDKICKNIAKKKFQPLERAYAALAIDKVYRDVTNPIADSTLFDYLYSLTPMTEEEMAKHLPSKKKENGKNVENKKKDSFKQKVKRLIKKLISAKR